MMHFQRVGLSLVILFSCFLFILFIALVVDILSSNTPLNLASCEKLLEVMLYSSILILRFYKRFFN